jgi:hypothetical protein
LRGCGRASVLEWEAGCRIRRLAEKGEVVNRGLGEAAVGAGRLGQVEARRAMGSANGQDVRTTFFAAANAACEAVRCGFVSAFQIER